MDIEWDPKKAASNLRKHGVDFADAATALFDELALTLVDESSDEERFITLGVDARGQMLVVVYSMRREAVRLISARRATRAERQQYEVRR